MNVGEAIKHLRKQRDIKQMEFCKMVGITQPYLSQVEKGHKKPSLEVLEDIANAFNVPLPILFWFTVEESDVDEIKIEAYRILKPTIDTMISTVFDSE